MGVKRREMGVKRWEARGGRRGSERREAGGETRDARDGRQEVGQPDWLKTFTSSFNQHYTYTQEVSCKSFEY